MSLVETWVNTKGWERIKRDITERICMGDAVCARRNRKGRAMGGIKEMIERDNVKKIEKGEELLSKKICLDGE